MKANYWLNYQRYSTVDVYYNKHELMIVMNDAFKSFEVSSEGNYTHPEYFIYDIKNLLSQIMEAGDVVEKWGLVDIFPHTIHVETVIGLYRKESAR